jgi:hypothetical protein
MGKVVPGDTIQLTQMARSIHELAGCARITNKTERGLTAADDPRQKFNN